MSIIKMISGNMFDSNAQMLCHQCNCIGVMGSGIAAEVKRRYPIVYADYRRAYEEGKLRLGAVVFSETDNDKHQLIANMCAQLNIGYKKRQTDYVAVKECLAKVLDYAKKHEIITVAFPYGMGSVRGGGNWNTVYSIIEEVFYKSDVIIEIWKL